MAKLDLLRKIIREEIRAAIQEQLSEILKEAIIVNRGEKQHIVETKKPGIPGTLNTRPFKPHIAPQLSPGNPLNSLLIETANSMSSLDFDSTDALGFGAMVGYQQEPQVADSISDMITSARSSSNFDMVQINAVPDYTELMSNLKAKGAI